MSDKNTNTEDTTATIEIDKIIEKDATIRMDKVIEKNTKFNGLKKWFGKYIITFSKKATEYITALANSVAIGASSSSKQISKYTTTCSKQISRTKFSAIMNAKYNEIYGEIRNELMKITSRLVIKNGPEKVDKFKTSDYSDTTGTKTQTIKKICASIVFIFKKILALVKCVVVFILNAATILIVFVARIVYFTAKEIIFSCKEIMLALKDAVYNFKRF
ncbi:hypothetical protein [Clostridium akagii]|uniref:hypothetical protein n=1 Tax=Clostridium akagii TaxID=91623 RepID=UPI000AABE38C|nr:hypothetical protein [Clostridium akagii]